MSAGRRPDRSVTETPRVFYGLVGGIVAVAFGVRLLYLTQVEKMPFFYHLIGDGATYWAWAGRIAAGDWLGRETFYQAPAYPYFLAVVRAVVGDDLWRAHVTQAVLGSLACGLLALAGHAFVSPRAGLCTGALLALYAPAIFFDGLIQKATLSLFLMSLLLSLLGWLTLRTPRRTRVAWRATVAFTIGVVSGLLALTQEQALPLGGVVLLWLLLGGAGLRPEHDMASRDPGSPGSREAMPPSREAGWRVAMPPGWAVGSGFFVLGMVLMLGLVAWRNYRVGGEVVLTTVQAGPNFYIGNHEGATGRYQAMRPGAEWPPMEQQAASELAEAQVGRKMTPREVSHYWFGKSWDDIKRHPVDWVGLLLYKWALVWNAYELSDTESIALYAHLSWLLGALGKLNHFGVFWPLAAVGLVATVRRWRSLWVLYAMILAVSGSIALFYVFARYRYPLVPLLAVFAGAGVLEIIRTLRWVTTRQAPPKTGETFQAPWVAAIVVGIVALASNVRFEHQRSLDATAYENWSVVLGEDGNYAAAAYLLTEALRYRPESAELHTRLGEALAAQNKIAAAVAEYRQALAIDPNYLKAREALTRAETRPPG